MAKDSVDHRRLGSGTDDDDGTMEVERRVDMMIINDIM